MKNVLTVTNEFKRVRYDLVVDGLILGCVILHIPKKNESKVDNFIGKLCASPRLQKLLDIKRAKELDQALPF